MATAGATTGAIVAILVLAFVYVGLAILAGKIAQRKGRPFRLYLLAGLILGPLVLLAALVLPKRRRV
jgi:predicted transporter